MKRKREHLNSDDDAPTECSPYRDRWDRRCVKMSFAELEKFISCALHRVTGSPGGGSADKAFPRTQEEFMRLCELLSEKAQALKEDSPNPLPTRPTYEGPPCPADLYKERGRAEEQEEYDERLRAYREARKLYTRQLELWLTKAKKREVEARRAETVESMYKRVESVFKQQRVFSADTQPSDSVPLPVEERRPWWRRWFRG